MRKGNSAEVKFKHEVKGVAALSVCAAAAAAQRLGNN